MAFGTSCPDVTRSPCKDFRTLMGNLRRFTRFQDESDLGFVGSPDNISREDDAQAETAEEISTEEILKILSEDLARLLLRIQNNSIDIQYLQKISQQFSVIARNLSSVTKVGSVEETVESLTSQISVLLNDVLRDC